MWNLFVNNHPESTFYHLPQYLQALEKESNQKLIRLVCADENGVPHGILPLLKTAGMPFNLGGVLTGKRISSLPRTPVAGPLVNNIESAKQLLNKAVELAQSSGEHRLQIKYDSADLGGLIPELRPVRWRKSYIKQLPENVQDLRFGKSSTHAAIKRAVKKAEKFRIKNQTSRQSR